MPLTSEQEKLAASARILAGVLRTMNDANKNQEIKNRKEFSTKQSEMAQKYDELNNTIGKLIYSEPKIDDGDFNAFFKELNLPESFTVKANIPEVTKWVDTIPRHEETTSPAYTETRETISDFGNTTYSETIHHPAQYKWVEAVEGHDEVVNMAIKSDAEPLIRTTTADQWNKKKNEYHLKHGAEVAKKKEFIKIGERVVSEGLATNPNPLLDGLTKNNYDLREIKEEIGKSENTRNPPNYERIGKLYQSALGDAKEAQVKIAVKNQLIEEKVTVAAEFLVKDAEKILPDITRVLEGRKNETGGVSLIKNAYLEAARNYLENPTKENITAFDSARKNVLFIMQGEEKSFLRKVGVKGQETLDVFKKVENHLGLANRFDGTSGESFDMGAPGTMRKYQELMKEKHCTMRKYQELMKEKHSQKEEKKQTSGPTSGSL